MSYRLLKFYALIIINSFFILTPVLANSQTIIKGFVKNNKNENLSFVNLSLLQDSSRLIKSTISDNKGEFSFNIADDLPLPLLLKATLIGYHDLFVKVSEINNSNNYQLKITLEELPRALKQVNITAGKPIYERKIDRFIFNVQNSILATGSNAFEAIAKAPGMSSNANTLSMIGKGGVKILVNNRDIRLSGDDLHAYLSSIPSESISSIEVITTPGARYDADGDAGIVNIIFKKNVNEGLLLISTSTYEQRKKPGGGQNISFNNRLKNANIYGFVNYNYNRTAPLELTTVYFNNSIWDTQNKRNTERTSSSFQLGADFDLSKNAVLSFLTEGTIYNHTKEYANAITSAYRFPSKQLDSVQDLQNNILRGLSYKNFDVNYRYVLDTLGSSLSIGGDYLFYDSFQDQDLISRSYQDASLLQTMSSNSTSPQDINIYVGKLDIEKKLPLRQNLSFGIKSTGTTIGNDYKFFNTSAELGSLLSQAKSNYFLYRENINALYISYGKDWERNNFLIGARTEYTTINTESRTLGTTNKTDYVKIFPSVFFMHVFSENHKLNFSYNVRINRPAYWELNPFKYFTSAYSYSEGNPDLKPAYVNNFQLNYTYRNKYFVTGYMQIEKGHFQQVPMINTTNNNYYYTRLNVGNIKTYGLQGFIPLKANDFWNINSQVNLFLLSQSTTYLNDQLSYDKINLYVNINNQLFIDKKKGIYSELNFFYNSPKQVFLNQSEAYYYFDFGLRKSFSKGSFGLNLFDIFKTIPYTVRVRYNNQNSDFKNNYESRFLRVSFTYKIGKQTIKDKKNRQLGNNEEKSRLN